MGVRGPVPKHSSERRRRNKESKAEQVAPITAVVKVPRISSHWHPIAKGWFKSLAESGQAQFYEPSDWQAARFVAETMTKQLNRGQPSAPLFAGIWSAMTDLLTTEASRRRVRIEVDRKGTHEEQPPGVTALDEYRDRLAG